MRPDTTFQPNGSNTDVLRNDLKIGSIIPQPDGKVLVKGSYFEITVSSIYAAKECFNNPLDIEGKSKNQLFNQIKIHF